MLSHWAAIMGTTSHLELPQIQANSLSEVLVQLLRNQSQDGTFKVSGMTFSDVRVQCQPRVQEPGGHTLLPLCHNPGSGTLSLLLPQPHPWLQTPQSIDSSLNHPISSSLIPHAHPCSPPDTSPTPLSHMFCGRTCPANTLGWLMLPCSVSRLPGTGGELTPHEVAPLQNQQSTHLSGVLPYTCGAALLLARTTRPHCPPPLHRHNNFEHSK